MEPRSNGRRPGPSPSHRKLKLTRREIASRLGTGPSPLKALDTESYRKESKNETRRALDDAPLVGEVDYPLQELSNLSSASKSSQNGEDRDASYESMPFANEHVRIMKSRQKSTTARSSSRRSKDALNSKKGACSPELLSLSSLEQLLNTTKRTESKYHIQATVSPSPIIFSTDTATVYSLDSEDALTSQNKAPSSDACHMISSFDHREMRKEQQSFKKDRALEDPDHQSEAGGDLPSSITAPEDTPTEDVEQLFREFKPDTQEPNQVDTTPACQSSSSRTTDFHLQNKKRSTNSISGENVEVSTYYDSIDAHLDLENAAPSTPLDFSSLVKRRKLDMSRSRSSLKKSEQTILTHKRADLSISEDSSGSLFTPMDAVSVFFSALSGEAVNNNGKEGIQQTTPVIALSTPEIPHDSIRSNEQQAENPMEIPLPQIPDTLHRMQCMISSTLIVHRGILRCVQHLCPSVEFIERDFSDQAAACPQNTKAPSTLKPVSISAIQEESDIIPSPTTGIVLTTIQKLHQRPLPGSNAPQALQARLAALAPKYEQIILLVSQSLSTKCPPIELSSADAIALAEVTAFTQSAYFKNLGTNISIILSLGGEEQASHWIVALVAKNCLNSESEANLLTQEEKPWETWLRTLGLNAFAAQAIIAVLASRSSNLSLPTQESPLVTLVRMHASERLRTLSPLLGKAAVDRLNTALDMRWASIR